MRFALFQVAAVAVCASAAPHVSREDCHGDVCAPDVIVDHHVPEMAPTANEIAENTARFDAAIEEDLNELASYIEGERQRRGFLGSLGDPLKFFEKLLFDAITIGIDLFSGFLRRAFCNGRVNVYRVDDRYAVNSGADSLSLDDIAPEKRVYIEGTDLYLNRDEVLSAFQEFVDEKIVPLTHLEGEQLEAGFGDLLGAFPFFKGMKNANFHNPIDLMKFFGLKLGELPRIGFDIFEHIVLPMIPSLGKWFGNLGGSLFNIGGGHNNHKLPYPEEHNYREGPKFNFDSFDGGKYKFPYSEEQHHREGPKFSFDSFFNGGKYFRPGPQHSSKESYHLQGQHYPGGYGAQRRSVPSGANPSGNGQSFLVELFREIEKQLKSNSAQGAGEHLQGDSFQFGEAN